MRWFTSKGLETGNRNKNVPHFCPNSHTPCFCFSPCFCFFKTCQKQKREQFSKHGCGSCRKCWYKICFNLFLFPTLMRCWFWPFSTVERFKCKSKKAHNSCAFFRYHLAIYLCALSYIVSELLHEPKDNLFSTIERYNFMHPWGMGWIEIILVLCRSYFY